MDYTIYRVTIDIAVPDYGNPTLGGRDFIDIHCDASELGFTQKRLELFEVIEDVKLNIDEWANIMGRRRRQGRQQPPSH